MPPCRVVGQDIARLSIADDNLIVLLHRLEQPTFFTRSDDSGNTSGSRRHLRWGKNAPTAVGGYAFCTSRAKYEVSRLDSAPRSGKL